MASSNTLLTPTVIAKEALMMLMNNLVMGKLVHRQYKNEFKKVGTTIDVRLPNRFTVTKAQARSNEDITEYKETFAVTTQAHTSWAFSSVELTMTIEEYSKRYISPAAAELANTVDYDLTGLYDDVFSLKGTPGTTPSNFSDLGDCQQVLDELAAPNPRVCVLNPAAHWSMADGLKGTFAQRPANDILTKGYLGTIANLDIHMDQNIRRHTTGDIINDTIAYDDTCAEGDTSVVCDGFTVSTSDAVLAGDVFTIDSVDAVNPKNRVSTGQLKQFVSLNDEDSDSGGHCTIDVMSSTGPGLRSTGSWTNVSALPAEDALVTFVGTEATEYPQNLIFHPNAFGLVTLPLAMPANTWGARITDKQMGMSIRVVKAYDIDADEEIIRLDILYGVTTLYPELACRLIG